METNTVEALPEAQESQTQCKCESLIADLQSRLEALEQLLDLNSLKTSDGRSLIVDHVTRSALQWDGDTLRVTDCAENTKL